MEGHHRHRTTSRAESSCWGYPRGATRDPILPESVPQEASGVYARHTLSLGPGCGLGSHSPVSLRPKLCCVALMALWWGWLCSVFQAEPAQVSGPCAEGTPRLLAPGRMHSHMHFHVENQSKL